MSRGHGDPSDALEASAAEASHPSDRTGLRHTGHRDIGFAERAQRGSDTIAEVPRRHDLALTSGDGAPVQVGIVDGPRDRGQGTASTQCARLVVAARTSALTAMSAIDAQI